MSKSAEPANAPLRWNRAMVFAAVVGTIIFAIAWAPVALQAWDNHRERVAAEPHPIPANDVQQAAIVRAILSMEHAPLQPPPLPPPAGRGNTATPSSLQVDPVERLPVGLLDRTLSLRSCDPPRPSGAIRCDLGGQMGKQLESEDRSQFSLMWRRELVAASLTATRVADPRIDGIVLVDEDSDAIGRLAGFSRAVLSLDGLSALVYFETRSHGLGVACILYKLVHTPTGWQVDEQEWHCVG
jgi:hypothetical protein